MIRGKFRALNVDINKDKKFQINNLSSHLKKLEKEGQNKPKASQRKIIIIKRAELIEIKNRNTIKKINETK